MESYHHSWYSPTAPSPLLDSPSPSSIVSLFLVLSSLCPALSNARVRKKLVTNLYFFVEWLASIPSSSLPPTYPSLQVFPLSKHKTASCTEPNMVSVLFFLMMTIVTVTPPWAWVMECVDQDLLWSMDQLNALEWTYSMTLTVKHQLQSMVSACTSEVNIRWEG